MKERLLSCLGGALGIAFIFWAISFGIQKQKEHDAEYPWRGTFYQLYENNGRVIQADNDQLKTVEECRDWAFATAEKMGLKDGEWDYDCGTGCEYADDKIESGRQIKTYDCDELTK